MCSRTAATLLKCTAPSQHPPCCPSRTRLQVGAYRLGNKTRSSEHTSTKNTCLQVGSEVRAQLAQRLARRPANLGVRIRHTLQQS